MSDSGSQAQTADFLIGTSGYSYDDWVGPVYPEGASRSAFLDHYAALFNFTEVNYTYYSLPAERTSSGMAERTPAEFRFVVKGHRSITHAREPGWSEHVKRFRAGIAPIADARKLSGVLLQFPFSFHYTTENRRYLAALCAAFDRTRLFLEFRNSEWQKENVYSHMEAEKLEYVVTDMPRLEGLPETHLRVTGSTLYVRFHGRNSSNWWTGDRVTRYDYHYAPEELSSWARRIRRIAAAGTSLVILAFNNHARGQAALNAAQLRSLLREEPPPPSVR